MATWLWRVFKLFLSSCLWGAHRCDKSVACATPLAIVQFKHCYSSISCWIVYRAEDFARLLLFRLCCSDPRPEALVQSQTMRISDGWGCNYMWLLDLWLRDRYLCNFVFVKRNIVFSMNANNRKKVGHSIMSLDKAEQDTNYGDEFISNT